MHAHARERHIPTEIVRESAAECLSLFGVKGRFERASLATRSEASAGLNSPVSKRAEARAERHTYTQEGRGPPAPRVLATRKQGQPGKRARPCQRGRFLGSSLMCL